MDSARVNGEYQDRQGRKFNLFHVYIKIPGDFEIASINHIRTYGSQPVGAMRKQILVGCGGFKL